jgi:hypothetical protein
VTIRLFLSEHIQRKAALCALLFQETGDRVDYVIVHNPAKARGDLFKGSQSEKEMMGYGTKSITLQ